MSERGLQVTLGLASVTGKRERNEDFVGTVLPATHQRATKGVVAAVADGVSGAAGGRDAAEVTVRTFLEAYYELPETLGVDRCAARAIAVTNRWVADQARNDSLRKNMATTFSAAIFRGRRAHIVHVGDTRIYRLRQHRVQLLTQDHTHHHPDLQHVLYRAVGLEDPLRVDYAIHGLEQHDRFLLCSDGVHSVLSDARIQALLEQRTDPQQAAQQLVDDALTAGSQDNITAVVLDVVEIPAAAQSELALGMAALPLRKPPKIGDVVDGFQLKTVLSDGRYSILMLAEDTQEHTKVVLKFPQPRVASDEVYRNAFLREAWIAQNAASPWVVDIKELAPERQSCLYSVMPFYEGQTLEQRLMTRPRIGLAEGIDIAIKLSKAIHTLHRRRIIHRDIKPENVFLLANGGFKLLDLGVARLPGLAELDGDEVPGTPNYMAPELFSGNVGDERSDIFALGVTLYRVFSAGKFPFPEAEAFARPNVTRRIPLGEYRPDLPPWLDTVLARATHPESAQRYADSMELAFELENGLARGAGKITAKKPLYERNPVKFWQVVSLLLALTVIGLLMRGAK